MALESQPGSDEQTEGNASKDPVTEAFLAELRSTVDNARSPSALQAWDVAKLGSELLPKFDLDQDTIISLPEFAQAMQDKTIKGPAAQALAGLYACKANVSLESLKESSNRQAVEPGQKIVRDLAKAAIWSAANFQNADTDKDGLLSDCEIWGALSSEKNKATANTDTTSALGFILENAKGLAGLYPDNGDTVSESPSVFDLYEANNKVKTDRAAFDTLAKMADRVAEVQAKPNNDRLFPTENPLDSITPNEINQGMLNNCFFLASVAAVALHNPELIRDAITSSEDGSYAVHFAGEDKETKHTVQPITDAMRGVYNRGALWTNVLESAFGDMYKNEPALGAKDALLPQESSPAGGYPGPVLKLLTGGTPIEVDISQADRAVMTVALEAIQQRKLPTVVGTKDVPDAELTSDGFIKNHAYTLMKYNPSTAEVTVRDPRGGKDAVRTISSKQFYKNFTTLTTVE